jgi:protein-disulfide isomerase
MLPRLLSLLAVGALVVAPAIAQTPKPRPAAARPAAATDWTRTVTLGANGAYILGNPNARTKLVEYMSYTCPHCSHFAAEGMASLKKDWIRRGLVSLEFRNFVRDPFDLTAALLARCGGAARFVGNHDALFANFDPWMNIAQTYNGAESADKVAQMADIADKTGLFALLAKRGLTPAAQRQCLADKQAMSDVLGLTANAWDIKEFGGTPFFLINGKALEHVHDWATLRPLLPPLPRSGN